jgi:hypothetical protein
VRCSSDSFGILSAGKNRCPLPQHVTVIHVSAELTLF